MEAPTQKKVLFTFKDMSYLSDPYLTDTCYQLNLKVANNVYLVQKFYTDKKNISEQINVP